jgi:hypothetical protein
MTHPKPSIDCPICNRKQSYSKKHDAPYCEHCNIWLAPVCYNRDCDFCNNRSRNPVKNIYSDVWRRIKIQDLTETRQVVVINKRANQDPRKIKKN